MIKSSKNKLYCFTPEIALATFIVESLLAIYVFMKHRTSKVGRLAFASLIFLALFQLSEYLICAGRNELFWYLIGWLSITLLPPLGLHLVSVVTGRNLFYRYFYFAGFVFMGIMIFYDGLLVSAYCAGNYVIFTSISPFLEELYKFYYYLGLILVVVGSVWPKGRGLLELEKKLLCYVVIGYLSFMVPTAIIIQLPSFGLHSLPSVLCGFAVIFAFILTFFIVPTGRKLDK